MLPHSQRLYIRKFRSTHRRTAQGRDPARGIAPGAKLAQVGLAERFGVSRIPVRDALALLAGEGLVQPLSNATAIVIRMSIEELQELYDLRLSIEPKTTGIAVPNVAHLARGQHRTIELIEHLRFTDRYVYLHLEVIGQTGHIGSEHAEILAAVERGDAATTARLTGDHLVKAHDHILDYLVDHPSVLDPHAVLSP